MPGYGAETMLKHGTARRMPARSVGQKNLSGIYGDSREGVGTPYGEDGGDEKEKEGHGSCLICLIIEGERARGSLDSAPMFTF